MPNIKSAIKRLRSNERKEERNRTVLSELKTINKKVLKLESNPEQAEEVSKLAISSYDKAASKGIIPQGRADRKKSRILKFVAKLKKAS